ncbi:OmpW/AlkL family protein [Zavarzinia compransoris]|uniref:OmpW family protein n=1 Tax=Zavarzinia compransoris TaxID=1264899 RepID=A0A317E304_9PROT|nr:OmpW family protein [Zavarzinia compransoris]PWR21011.1 OmpW family protein [Zavarzinia compransoris]TDP44043.1 outer membrane protein [Zavarzinia compransoris]
MLGRLMLIAATLAGPMIAAAEAAAADRSPWMVRGRVLAVLPEEDLDSINPVLGPNTDVSIDNSVVPELDITYFLTPNIAAELILGTTPHDAKVKSPDVDLGSVWLLPPTLTLQYHFAPEGKIRPYLGVGVNYTIFYGKDEPGGTTVDYENRFGWALQAGVDIPIDDHWALNVDVKQIFLSTEVTVNGAVKADVDIDPLLVGVGVGYRF